jgi:uncharacterized protein YlxW (UPF0749 family)
MKKIYKILLFILICLLPAVAISQEKTKDKPPPTSRFKQKAAKKKWKEQRKLERQQAKAVKDHHKRIQTKKTRKEMRKTRKKGDKARGNKREFFLVRWFKYRN